MIYYSFLDLKTWDGGAAVKTGKQRNLVKTWDITGIIKFPNVSNANKLNVPYNLPLL